VFEITVDWVKAWRHDMWIGLSLFAVALATLAVVSAVLRTTQPHSRGGNSDSPYIGL
jgi:hypothetical protein